jgi:hypothetical protein
VSPGCAGGTAQCRDQLEEQSSDEQAETTHGQRKRAIGRWLTPWATPRTTLQRTEFRTKHKERPGIPGALLDIIVESICVALPEMPQSGSALRHFPNPQDHHPEEVEKSPSTVRIFMRSPRVDAGRFLRGDRGPRGKSVGERSWCS